MLPSTFLNSLQGLPGFDQISFEAVHDQGVQITSGRLNKFKKIEITEHPFLKEKTFIPWCKQGFYLPQRPSFVLDPLWHAGAYYVQEASSMFVQYVLDQIAPNDTQYKVLDLCAAPGGKTTLLANHFKDGLVVANETIKSRNSILVENVTKWGADNVVITQNDPSHFKSLPQFFDLILIDAPCSGSGLFRKDVGAIKEWSVENVQHCSARQARIIEESIGSLKIGGYLIYSTCSYSLEEDELILDKIASIEAMNSIAMDLPAEWQIVSTTSPVNKAQGFRFYPDKVKGEGFFIAVFQKQEDSNLNYSVDQFKLTSITKNELAVLTNYFEVPVGYKVVSHQQMLIAIPAAFEQAILTLLSHLYIKKMGLAIGELKGKDLIPAHALAMSYMPHLPFVKKEVDLPTALNYLRRSSIELEGEKGWNLITYHQIGLGWAKILPNRINNYYPNEWRILNY